MRAKGSKRDSPLIVVLFFFVFFFPSSNPSRGTIFFFFTRKNGAIFTVFDPSARIIGTFEGEIRVIAYEIRGSSGFDCRHGMAQ